MPLRLTAAGSALVCVVALVAACAPEPVTPVVSPPEGGEHTWEADVARGSHGIAHITAEDLGSLAFGQGWAQAEDHACTIGDQVMKLRSERAMHLGPGADGEHIRSDVAYGVLGLHERAWERWTQLSPEGRDVVVGFVEGFNAWLAETGTDGVEGWCSGHDWLGPIAAVDLLAYHEDLALVDGARLLIDAIATGELADPAVLAAEPVIDGIAWPLEDGSLLSMTHTPWEGELRMWESHLQIPGELNVYGATLVGLPMVLVGFNESLAWSQVTAAGNRHAAAVVERVGSADISEVTVEVQVRQDDGTLASEAHTAWTSDHGPIIDRDERLAVAGPDPQRAPLVEHLLELDSARSIRSVERIRSELGPMAWMATVAVGDNGQIWRDPGVDPEGPSGRLPEPDPEDQDGSLDISDLAELALENRSTAADELRADIVAACEQTPIVTVEGATDPDGQVVWEPGPVDLSDACDVLRRWDATFDLDRQGAVLFHELGTRTGGAEDLAITDVMTALGEVVLTVEAAGFEVDDRWRDVQWTRRGGEDIPIHGGGSHDGTYNRVRHEDRFHSARRGSDPVEPLVEGGSIGQRGRLVNAGTSYVLAVSFGTATPEAEAILSAGQSADRSSPFYADQMYRFSDRAWRPVAYDGEDVAAGTVSQRTVRR